MIIRFRSKDGMFRVSDIDAFSEDLKSIVETKLLNKLPLGVSVNSIFLSDKANEKGKPLDEFVGKDCNSLGLKNGDMLFLSYEEEKESVDSTASVSASVSAPEAAVAAAAAAAVLPPLEKKQLPIDDELDKEEGLIKRPRSNFCKHTDKGMCELCVPLPPWDKNYQQEHNIKHISYHAYLNELNDNSNKKNSSSSYISPLEEPNFKIDKNCKGGHAPWPNGICSKCQPSAITLAQQPFRMVDHVEFGNSEIINNFINSWRKSGKQRIGLLLGKYDKYDKVPLGIKAHVETIYEFPQLDETDGIIIQDFKLNLEINKIINFLKLKPIGLIFTDLTDSGLNNGSVLCKRHKDSFFLSSLEVIFAAKQQLSHPNYSKWSDSGIFSSKFITCCITGNLKGEIDIFSYQVSNSAEKLVDADIISGSTHPNEVFISETNKDRYVPEIFYMMVNEYGITVKKNAKPSFPVEYLIVTLTHGFPQLKDDEKNLFLKNSFPIENRNYIGESQDLLAISKSLGIEKNNYNLDLQKLKFGIFDFHLICYLISELDLLNENEKNLILKTVRDNSDTDFYQLLESPGFQTLITIIRESI